MKITIIAVGKPLSKELQSVALEYEKRLKPHATILWKLISPSQAHTAIEIKQQESAAILSALQPNDTVILLDERGVQQSNEQFALNFEKLSGTHGRCVIVIGGAYGVTEPIRDRAAFIWSFSKLVFPHQLIRVLLTEQLYRTYMIQIGHPYHHND